MTVGERIGIYAQEKNINLHKLSKNAGVSYNTLYSIVRRKSDKIDADILAKVAKALEIPVFDLLGFKTSVLDSLSVEVEVSPDLTKLNIELAEKFYIPIDVISQITFDTWKYISNGNYFEATRELQQTTNHGINAVYELLDEERKIRYIQELIKLAEEYKDTTEQEKPPEDE